MTFQEEAVRACDPDCRWLTIGAALAASGGISAEFNVPWLTIPLILSGLGFMGLQWWKNTRRKRHLISGYDA